MSLLKKKSSDIKRSTIYPFQDKKPTMKIKRVMKIGFIGLDIMGYSMAGHLVDHGYELYTYSNLGTPSELVLRGAIACDSPSKVFQKSNIIILMLPESSQVEEVLLGKNGLVNAAQPGCLIIDMSSASPMATREFACKVEAKGFSYLDAPISGNEINAKEGSLTIMVGGNSNDFDKALPIFQILGRSAVHVGGHGDGQACKISNQLIVEKTFQAVAEGLHYAEELGVNPKLIREALDGERVTSRVLEFYDELKISSTLNQT